MIWIWVALAAVLVLLYPVASSGELALELSDKGPEVGLTLHGRSGGLVWTAGGGLALRVKDLRLVPTFGAQLSQWAFLS